MAGSLAEERIRAKVEASLRAEFPGARIVHELKMDGGLVRLDLAAVRADAITVVEIKSERDVLKRLRSQIEAALQITGDVRLYAAEKHSAALTRHLDMHERDEKGHWKKVWTDASGRPLKYGTSVPNPDYIPRLADALILIEGEDAFTPLSEAHSSWWPRKRLEHMPDPRELLELLWADELRAMGGKHRLAVDSRSSRGIMIRLALEHMTGREIRQAVFHALRGRQFARADAAVSA